MRAVIGWSLLLGGTGGAFWYGASAVRAWLLYRAWVARDPSGAELYLLNCRFASAAVLLGLGLACLGWRLVRRRAATDAPAAAA